jgi:spermidine synthase
LPAKVEIVLGDARLSLEREAPQNFDVLVVDAFSGDSIPVHLITVEAFAEYLRHLKPQGVIVFHVSNRFLDLMPVVKALADAHGLRATWVRDEAEGALASRSDWVLLARRPFILVVDRGGDRAGRARPDWRL